MAVEANPQVAGGVGVAHEEPAVGDARVAEPAREWADVVDENAIGARHRAIEVRVQPLRAGLEAAPRLADRRPRPRPSRSWCIGATPREGDDELMRVPSVGAVYRTRLERWNLAERQHLHAGDRREEGVDAQNAGEVHEQPALRMVERDHAR